MGEPAGIGTEIALRAWLALRATDSAFFILHDPEFLTDIVRSLSLEVPVSVISRPEEARGAFRDGLPVMRVSLAAAVDMGRPDARNAAAVALLMSRSTRGNCATTRSE